MLLITDEQNKILQDRFRDFIIPKPGSRPMPILMASIFEVAKEYMEVTESVFAEMCDYDKSKEKFSLYYPLFIDVSMLTNEELINKKSERGVKGRYLDKVFSLGEKKYLACKEFYINKGGYKTKLYEWICEMFGMDRIDFVNEIDVNVAISDFENELDANVAILDLGQEMDNSDNPQSISSSKALFEVEYLDNIRTSAECILMRVEKDCIQEVIAAIKNAEDISDEQVRGVEKIIEKLRVYKEILVNIEL